MLGFEVHSPDSHVAWDEPVFRVHLSRYARALEVTYPLRPAIHLVASVEEPDLTAGSLYALWQTCGQISDPTPVRVDFAGRLCGPRVPYFRGAEVSLRLLRDPTHEDGLLSFRQVAVGSVHLPMQIPSVVEVSLSAKRDTFRYQFEGDLAEGAFPLRTRRTADSLRAFRDNAARHRFEQGSGESDDSPVGTARVRVRTILRDGAPGSGLLVWCRQEAMRTDSEGRVLFQGLCPGEVLVCCHESGFNFPVARLVLGPGSTEDVTLREAPSGELVVWVRDARGRGLPFATVLVNPLRATPVLWADQVARTQRVDTFTDRNGEIVFSSLVPGSVRVVASWGGLSSHQKVSVRAGETSRLEVVLDD